MDDFVKPQNEKISQNPKVSFLPTEKRYIMLTDEDGNIKGCFPLKKKSLGKGWIALYQNPAGWLAQQRLTGEQYSVLFALFNRLDFDNYLRISRQDIADFLNMQPVNVSRAMKKLKELEIIIEDPFWSEENQKHLQKSIREFEEGKVVSFSAEEWEKMANAQEIQ